MSVEATGTLDGRPATLTFVDGVLGGDPYAVEVTRALIREGIDTCIPGVVGGRASLADDWRSAATFLAVLDEGARLNVDSPPYDLPEGAIA